MLVLAILLLILVGIALLVVEFFIFVGSAIAGIAGFILTAIGVFLTYKSYGTTAGHVTLLATFLLFISVIYFSFRSKTWKKIALHSEIDGKVNSIEEFHIAVGDKGITVSKLAPMGKVRLGNATVEAKSLGIYVAENTEIEVVSVSKSNIIVKPFK
jgi:membrane-bound ClpP family serine protease